MEYPSKGVWEPDVVSDLTAATPQSNADRPGSLHLQKQFIAFQHSPPALLVFVARMPYA